MNVLYSLDEWNSQNEELAAGAKPRACPKCGRLGFYGTFKADGPRFYHACKFCGFWQHVGEAEDVYRATAHNCEEWPRVLGAPYVWYIGPSEEEYECGWCHGKVHVADSEIEAPIGDTDHPWWRVPQNLLTREAYREWWRRHRVQSTFGYLG